MHHVKDIDAIITKFHALLNPGACIALADLYPEDGSFHGEEFDGHHGFDVEILARKLDRAGFKNIGQRQCYILTKQNEDSSSG